MSGGRRLFNQPTGIVMAKNIVCIATEMCFRDGKRFRAGDRVVVALNEGEELPHYLVPKDKAKVEKKQDGHEGAGLITKGGTPVDSSAMHTPVDPDEVELSDPEDNEEAGASISASASAKALAEENNVDLGQVQGTGANGSITKTDVQKFMDEGTI